MTHRRWPWILIALAPCPALADTFTVGAGGTHATIDAAFGAALTTPGAHEIRVQAGDHQASVSVSRSTGFNLDVSGGWDASFTHRGDDPLLTRWRASPGQPVLRLDLADNAQFRLSRMRLTDGTGVANAGGIAASLSGTAVLDVQRVQVDGNTTAGPSAAGIRALASINSVVNLDQVRVTANRATGTSSHNGIGAALLIRDDAAGFATASVFDANSDAAGSTSTYAGGLLVDASQRAYVALTDLEIRDQRLEATSVGGAGLGVSASGNSTIRISRLRVTDNLALVATTSNRSQMDVAAFDSVDLRIDNTLVARGSGAGLIIALPGAAAVRLSNLTVVAHPLLGVVLDGGSGPRSLHNSIIDGNGGASVANSVVRVANLGSNINGVAPRFVDSWNDLRLQPDSPARDAGTANLPSGTVGPFDVAGNPRVLGAEVDIGAYEYAGDDLFVDGFEP